MTGKRDLVLGAVGGLGWESVEVWARSLATSGFKGIGAMIVYDDNRTVIDNLTAMGFQVFTLKLNGLIMIQRFHDFHQVIASAIDDLRYVVIADVRDVFFQSDPVAWLERSLSKPFLAVTESILHRHENWNRQNAELSYPAVAARLLDQSVYCAGVMAGEAKAVSDLVLALSIFSRAGNTTTADQAAYNLMLSMEPYKSACQFTRSEDGFTCQVGVLGNAAAIEREPFLLEPRPVVTPKGVTTAGGDLYAIVHQYDRAPAMQQALMTLLAARSGASSGALGGVGA